MDERALQTFLTVAQLGSYSRAAEVLYVTQSTVTARINKLERELETSLFVREPRGVALTESGRAFIPYVQRCLQNLEDARSALAHVESGTKGVIRVGACPIPAAYDLPVFLKELKTTDPGMTIHMQTATSKAIYRRLLRNEVDVGFVHIRFRHPELQTKIMCERPIAVVGKRPDPNLKLPVIFYQEELEDALLAQSICHQLGFASSDSIGLSDLTAVKAMVFHELGIGILPRTAVSEELHSNTFFELTDDESGALPHQITCLVVRKQSLTGERARLMDRFAARAEDHYRIVRERASGGRITTSQS